MKGCPLYIISISSSKSHMLGIYYNNFKTTVVHTHAMLSCTDLTCPETANLTSYMYSDKTRLRTQDIYTA